MALRAFLVALKLPQYEVVMPVMIEEHGKWKESAELDKDTLQAKQVFFLGSNA